MARLYGDENFDVHTMEELNNLEHDVLTARDAGKINQRIPDHEVLAFAAENSRAVVTFDRRDYFHLHKAGLFIQAFQIFVNGLLYYFYWFFANYCN